LPVCKLNMLSNKCYGMSVCLVRQVIPIIRSNDTKGTPDIDYSHHKKRSVDDQEQNVGNPTFFEQPAHAQSTYRAAKRVRKDVLESRILEKRLRFLRAVGLREIEKNTAKRRKRRVVPRVSYPVRIDQVTKKKISFVPRYFLSFWFMNSLYCLYSVPLRLYCDFSTVSKVKFCFC